MPELYNALILGQDKRFVQTSFACSNFNLPKLKNSFSGLIEKQVGTYIGAK